MIENYKKEKFESKGIDLNNFNKEEMIEKFKNTTVSGINVLLLIFKAPVTNQLTSGLYVPYSSVDSNKEYAEIVGMVLKYGPDAYKGSQFPSGAYVKPGDWVIFPRGSSQQFKYEDEPVVLVEDFKLKLVVDDPSKISR